MATTVYTQAHVDAFKLAMVDRKGATTIVFGDQSATFGSYAEQIAFVAWMQEQVNASAGSGRNYRLASFRKGV
jgi:hypothetical protein